MRIEVDRNNRNIVLVKFKETILQFDMSTNGGYKLFSRIVIALDSLISGGAAVRTIELQYSGGYFHTLTLSKDCGGVITYMLEKKPFPSCNSNFESGILYDAKDIIGPSKDILFSFSQPIKEMVE